MITINVDRRDAPSGRREPLPLYVTLHCEVIKQIQGR